MEQQHSLSYLTILRNVLCVARYDRFQPRNQLVIFQLDIIPQFSSLYIFKVLHRQHLRACHQVQSRLQYAKQIVHLLAHFDVVVHVAQNRPHRSQTRQQRVLFDQRWVQRADANHRLLVDVAQIVGADIGYRI